MPANPTHIFDARRGEDFQLQNRKIGVHFSSRQHGFVLINSCSHRSWGERLTFLQEAIAKSGSKLGFVTVKAWALGARALIKTMQAEYLDSSQHEASLIIYLSLQSIGTDLTRVFRIRERFGGSNSGEWGFGGCPERFSAPTSLSPSRARSWDLFQIVGQPEILNCYLYFGEMDQITFLVKPFEGLSASLATIV
jgi:hypothetical protein